MRLVPPCSARSSSRWRPRSPRAAAPEERRPWCRRRSRHRRRRPRSAGSSPTRPTKPALVFGVSSFTVTRDGWRGRHLGREPLRRRLGGRRSRRYEAALRFGVLLFPTDDLDELERRNRPATCRRSAPRRATPRRSRACCGRGTTWSGHDLGARCARRRSLGPDLVRPLRERRRAARGRPVAGGLVHRPRIPPRRGGRGARVAAAEDRPPP